MTLPGSCRFDRQPHPNAPSPRQHTRRAGARPRRAPANLPGTLAPTDQAPEPVIARSAATWQSVPPQCGSIAPAARPVVPPGRYCAPAGACKPCGVQGNGLPRQRARWFAMTDLGVRRVWRRVRRFRQVPGRVMTLPGDGGFSWQFRPKAPGSQNCHCEERSDVAIRSPQCERIAPAVRPVNCPGRCCAPGGARKPRGLQGTDCHTSVRAGSQ